MKGSIKRYCLCVDPATGKRYGARCPGLSSSKHGEWEYVDRIRTSTGEGDVWRYGRFFRRRGFRTKGAGEDFQKDAYRLLDLADGDDATARRIGDLIFARTNSGGQLPQVEEIRRRLGAGVDIAAPSITVRAYAADWLAGKRKLKRSVARLYRQHLDHYLLPALGDIPVARLRAEQIAGMFDLIEEWNAEIVDAKAEGRRPVLPGDVRKRSGVVSATTQARILATLRAMLNDAIKPPRRFLDFNPCAGVDLPDGEYYEARVWAPEQVAHFLAASAGDRLASLFRIVLLRGLRRGEACGLREVDVDLDEEIGRARIAQTLLQLGGQLVWDTPKSQKSRRTVALDAGTVVELRALRKRAREERMRIGELYDDHGLVFAREDGTPYPPDFVSRRFKELAAEAGLPVIRLHEGRHTAATLALEGGVDSKVVQELLGHSTSTFTRDRYQHVRLAMQDQAAATVVELVGRPKGRRSGGSAS